jgi:hypothetical protein
MSPGKGETRKGEPRATRLRENFKVRSGGETPSYVWRRKLWAVGKGKTFQAVAEGKLRVIVRKESPEPPAKGRLEPLGLGETPVIWRKESSEPPAMEVLGATRVGGNSGSWAMRKS